MKEKEKKTQQIYELLVKHSHEGVLPKGLKYQITVEFEVSYGAVHRIWIKKKQTDKAGKIVDLTDGRINNGREAI